MLKSTVIIRLTVLLVIVCVGWYSIQIYMELFGRMNRSGSRKESTDLHLEFNLVVNDIDKKELEAADEEWKKQQNLFLPIVKKLNRNPCSPISGCSSNEFSFKLITGAANALGPSICFNGKIVMKSSLNNVDRGMNVAVFNGTSGEAIRQTVFDLFDKDSTEIKKFLKELKPDQVILVASSDDAGSKLDDEAKELLAGIGSTKAKDLGFRDNWVFVGGLRTEHPSKFEKFIKNEKAKNRYGDWPEAISIEGCLPKLT